MTIKKAVDHFIFKFKNVWKPTQKDAEALNIIMKFVEDKHKKQIQDFHLFAKLYITVYGQYLERYKTTIFDDIPRKELHKLLDLPVSHFIEKFTDNLNQSELYSLFDELGVKMEHTERTKDHEIDAIQESIKDPRNFEKFTGQVWKLEDVTENLELQINNVINQFN